MYEFFVFASLLIGGTHTEVDQIDYVGVFKTCQYILQLNVVMDEADIVQILKALHLEENNKCKHK